MSPLDMPTKQDILDLLLDAFPRPEDMEMLLALRLDKNFAVLASTGSYQTDLFRVLQAADAQGWMEALLRAACDERPLREDLREAVDGYLSKRPWPEELARRAKEDAGISIDENHAGDTPSLARMLQRGMSGADVKTMQGRLLEFGFLKMVDGIFGLETEYAVKEFQHRNELDADGIVGPKTWAKLWEEW